MKVYIGVDPHKLSVTIEVVDDRETVLAIGRFSTDNAGYAAMLKHVAAWPERVWAVEGSNGAGRPLAQRLLADGEHVVDVPAKLAARARLFDTGHNRKDRRPRRARGPPYHARGRPRPTGVGAQIGCWVGVTWRRHEPTRLREPLGRLRCLLFEVSNGKVVRM